MNRKIALFATIAAAIVISGCGRDRSTNPSGRSIGKRLIRAGHVSIAYDSEGRVQSLIEMPAYTYEMMSSEFHYQDGLLADQEILMAYGEGESSLHRYVYEYDTRGFLSRVTQLNIYDDRIEPSFKWAVRCDSLGRPVVFDWLWADGSTSPRMEFVFDSDGNIRTEKTDFSGGVAQTVTSYEYDRFLNPFTEVKGVMHFFHGFNRNNPLTSVTESTVMGLPRRTETRHEYVYDDAGYPVYARTYLNGELNGETKYEYEPVPEAD
ncbi:MAG: hypothetical protein QUS35_06450 [bacterium]|nr:hypothetical protein [bacterium]